MVRATRQAFSALRSAGNAEIPTNLRILYTPAHGIRHGLLAPGVRQPSRRAVVRRPQPSRP